MLEVVEAKTTEDLMAEIGQRPVLPAGSLPSLQQTRRTRPWPKWQPPFGLQFRIFLQATVSILKR